jgi:LacI family transcriptional regulator
MEVNIPNDIKIISFDKSEAFEFMNIPIPYNLQPIPEMGEKEVELLVEQIKNNTIISKCIELQASLINIPNHK